MSKIIPVMLAVINESGNDSSLIDKLKYIFSSLESISRPASCDTTKSRDLQLPQVHVSLCESSKTNFFS